MAGKASTVASPVKYLQLCNCCREW